MPCTVLIWTPYRELRNQLSAFLGGSGFAVLVTETPHQALEIAEQRGREIDLVLADHSVESGRELAQALAASLRMKALLITGEPEYITRARLPHPWVEFIEKPFAWCELKRKVDTLSAGCGS